MTKILLITTLLASPITMAATDISTACDQRLQTNITKAEYFTLKTDLATEVKTPELVEYIELKQFLSQYKLEGGHLKLDGQSIDMDHYFNLVAPKETRATELERQSEQVRRFRQLAIFESFGYECLLFVD